MRINSTNEKNDFQGKEMESDLSSVKNLSTYPFLPFLKKD